MMTESTRRPPRPIPAWFWNGTHRATEWAWKCDLCGAHYAQYDSLSEAEAAYFGHRSECQTVKR